MKPRGLVSHKSRHGNRILDHTTLREAPSLHIGHHLLFRIPDSTVLIRQISSYSPKTYVDHKTPAPIFGYALKRPCAFASAKVCDTTSGLPRGNLHNPCIHPTSITLPSRLYQLTPPPPRGERHLQYAGCTARTPLQAVLPTLPLYEGNRFPRLCLI